MHKLHPSVSPSHLKQPRGLYLGKYWVALAHYLQIHAFVSENNIDEKAVLLLGDDELKELFPKIGPRMKFKKYTDSFKTQELAFNVSSIVTVNFQLLNILFYYFILLL